MERRRDVYVLSVVVLGMLYLFI